jgi:hypothetical protein
MAWLNILRKVCVRKKAKAQGLKPASFQGGYGTSKLVPCYKSGWFRCFSASCKAVPLQSGKV